MSRLIDADELEKELEKMTQDFLDDKTIQGSFCAGVTVEMLEEVRKAPTIDAVPVVHGRWIFINVTDDSSVRKDKCFNCGYILTSYNYNMPTRYCPDCGAKMDEVIE